MRKNKLSRKVFIEYVFVTSALLITLFSISVGYAYYNEELDVNGLVVVSPSNYAGILDVVNITEGSSNNGSYQYNNYYRSENDTSVTFSINNTITFNNNSNDYVEYVVTIYNDSNETYTYNGFSNSGYSNPWFSLSTPRVLGINKGDVIKPGESKTVSIIYYYNNTLDNTTTLYYQDYLVFLIGKQDISKGSVVSNINVNSIKTDSNTTLFNAIINVNNNYDVSVKYNIKLSNSNINLVDSSGNIIDYTYCLDKASSNSNNIYFSINSPLADGESINTDIYLELENGDIVTVGNINIYVPEKTESGDSNNNEEDASIDGVTMDTIIEERTGWSNHYKVSLTINNSNDYDLKEWTVKIKLDDTLVLDDYTTYLPNNYKATVSGNTIIITSAQRWSSNYNTVSANSSFTVDEFTLGLSSNEFNLDTASLIKSVVIYPYVEEIGT